MKKAMSQKVLALIISLIIAIVLIVILLSLVGPQVLTEMVSNALDKWNINDFSP